MSQHFHLELVSPEQRLLSEPVAMVTVPGDEGDFGVLPGHAPLVSSLRMGVMRIYRHSMSDEPQRIFIAGGFADVGAGHCTILAEQATDMGALSLASLEAEYEQCQKRIQEGDAASTPVKQAVNRLKVLDALISHVRG